MPRVLDQPKTTSDLILDPVVSNSYTREGRKIANQTASEQKLVNLVGYPVKVVSENWEIIDGDTVDDETNTVGLLVEARSVELAATTGVSTAKYQAIVRGPAVLKEDGLATADPSGTAYNMTQIKAALAALNPPIIIQDSTSNLEVKPLHDGAFPE